MTLSILVFIVEDEVLIQDLLESPLTDGGYAVAKAASAEEALRMLEEHASDFQALITDVNLGSGSLSGWDIARRARELNPALPVIYMTGDSGHDWAVNGVPKSLLIMKPFAPAQIVTAVSQLLNANVATPPGPEEQGA